MDFRYQEEKRGRLIDIWLQKNGDDATYDDMITAMLKAEYKEHATSVCSLLYDGIVLQGYCTARCYTAASRTPWYVNFIQ